VARAIGVKETRNPEDRIGSERQRIQKVVVDTPIDDIDAAQPGRRPHVDDVVVNYQVAPFDQLYSHLARQKRMFIRGGVEQTRSQQQDRRIGAVLGSESPQSRQQRLSVMIDRPYVVAAEEAGKDLLHNLPVGKHVGDAARYTQVVFEHHELAAVETYQVC